MPSEQKIPHDAGGHDTGCRPAVVLIHDAEAGPEVWAAVAADLAWRLRDRLIWTPAVTAPESGGSPAVRLLARLARGSAPLHLAGEGTGAAVAVELALMLPERTLSLTLASPATGGLRSAEESFASAGYVACPGLVLVGDSADRTARRQAALIAARMAEAPTILVDGGGNRLADTHPRTLGAAMAQHMAAQERRPERARRPVAA